MKTFVLLVSLSLGTALWADTRPVFESIKTQRFMSDKNQQVHTYHHKDRDLRHRTFRTVKAFQREKKRTTQKVQHHLSKQRGRSYGRDRYKHSEHRMMVRRGHRDYRDSWYLAYRYEQAPFYDRHGYYYGYFDHRGYMFEGEFYRYDRFYTYHDRVRGKGLFEHRYYKPLMEYIGYNDRCYR